MKRGFDVARKSNSDPPASEKRNPGGAEATGEKRHMRSAKAFCDHTPLALPASIAAKEGV